MSASNNRQGSILPTHEISAKGGAHRERNQFLICVLGVFTTYLVYGYLQELIFTLEGISGWYLTLIQFLYYTIFGIVSNKQDLKNRRIPIRIYILLAFLTLGTMSLSNASLGYLNYPTQVIFKCCKLIPVLIGSILIQKKKHSLLDFVAAACMCIGLIFFTLADSKVQPNFNMYGVIMISTALLFDAAIGNVQEKAMKEFKAPNSEVVLYSYGIGFFYLFMALLFSGHLFSGFTFCMKYPLETYGYGFLFSLSGYLGIQFVLTLVKTVGAHIAVTVTTARKAVTIALSFLIFFKPFTFDYVWSGMIVVLGIYLNVIAKKSKLTVGDVRNKILELIRRATRSSKENREDRKLLLDV